MRENTINIIGKSNTGKTKNVLFKEIENEIKNNKNLLVLDSKEEYYNNFGEMLKNKGYVVNVINFKNPLKSNGWEPLEYANYLYNNGEIDKAIEMIKKIGMSIFKCGKNEDPFWSQSSSDYFVGLVLILMKITKETEKLDYLSFCSIYNMINDGETKYKDSNIIKEYCKQLNIMDPAYIAMSPTIFAPIDTKDSILSVMKQQLNNYFMRPQLLQSFYNNGFKVSELKDHQKTATFIIGYNPVNSLTNLLIEYIYDFVINNNINMTFILDNFDSLEELENLEEMINDANEGKIKLYLTNKNMDKTLDKYSKFIFSEIEKNINLEDIYEEEVHMIKCELPDLENKKANYINFEEYVINLNK